MTTTEATPCDPQHGDRVRIVCTSPTPGESTYEGVVHRQAEDLTGFELRGRWITRGQNVHRWFAVDKAAHPNSPAGYSQTTTLIQGAQS